VRELTIEAIGAHGDGVAEGHYAPFTLPGERVLATIAGDRAEVVELLGASGERVAPPCVHFGDCGGCALQHWAQEPYLVWKVEQLRQALARVRLETKILPPFAAPPHSRRRLALHARRIHGQVVLGLKARRTWRVVAITDCVVAEPALVRALPALKAVAAPFLNHPKSAPTLHVTNSLTGLDVEVTGVEARTDALPARSRMIAAEAAAGADLARLTLGGEVIYQARAPVVRLGPATVALPPGAFLQAVAAAEAAIAAFACEAMGDAARIADLYCGVGAFTFPLAMTARVIAADISQPAIRALSAAQGTAAGLKGIAAEARDLDRRPFTPRELAGVDSVIIDPPRAGAAAQHRHIALSNCARVVGVSCNPATFVRDARILADAGFRLAKVKPVDQFLWSPHIELVSLFVR
jgi:23S rRNA (uracil1939-C5)-methyltransferase